jgi:hypothetical protein
MVAGLLVIADWIVGAERTRPSSANATFVPMLAAVYSAQTASAVSSKQSRTTGSPVVSWPPARASVA